MQPAIERPLETDSNLLSADSPCHSGSELGDAHSRSNEPELPSNGGVSPICTTTSLSLLGLAIEGVPHDICATELALRVGTEQHSAGYMLEALTTRTHHLASGCISSNYEEKHASTTEASERIEITGGSCGTPFPLAEMARHALQDDDASGAVSDNPPSSSLPPSSSPAQVFSSSPLASSQSSSVPSDKVSGIAEMEEYSPPNVCPETRIRMAPEPSVCSDVRKRPAEASDLVPLSEIGTEQMSPQPKRIKVEVDDAPLPVPKRLTQASQQRQYRKLVTPFRSPLLTTTGEPSRRVECSSVKSEPVRGPGPATSNSLFRQPHSSPSPQGHFVRSKITTGTRTGGAAAQFKSPVMQSAGSSPGVSSRPSIRLTPTVQMLEHRLQVLRRAVKVKEDEDEEILQQLVTRWTDAGREAAYQLWDLAKDTGDLQSKSTDLGSIWSRGATTSSDINWGWDKPEDDVNDRADWHGTEEMACEEDEPRNTLGTMLRQLRIDPVTLGWDEQTETFID